METLLTESMIAVSLLLRFYREVLGKRSSETAGNFR